MYPRRRGGQQVGLLLLIFQIVQIGINNIPPVTLFVCLVNIFAHYFLNAQVSGNFAFSNNPSLANLPRWDIWDVCIGAPQVYGAMMGAAPLGELWRLLAAAFFHVDDIHLYYNMSSLLLKGRQIEPIVGRRRFGLIVLIFSVLCNLLYVGGSVLLAKYLDMPGTFRSCAVGFSAVLFALKVLATTYSTSSHSSIMGFITVPTKYVYWAELVLISLLVPQASFFGHLCGILVGLLYVRGSLEPVFRLLERLLDNLTPAPGHGNDRPTRDRRTEGDYDGYTRGSGGGYMRDGVLYRHGGDRGSSSGSGAGRRLGGDEQSRSAWTSSAAAQRPRTGFRGTGNRLS